MKAYQDCSDRDEVDDNQIKVLVQDPLRCQPKRARRINGRYTTYPGFTDTSAETNLNAVALTDWRLEGLTSTPGLCQVTFNKKKSTFAFLSVKTRRTQTGEGPYELMNAKEKEVDPTVVDYELHGFQLTLSSDDRYRRYTPDAVSVSADGTIVIDEVKASASYFFDPETKAVVEAAEAHLPRVGMTFRRVTGEDLQASQRRRYNISDAFANRFAAFTAAQVDVVRGLFTKDPEQPLGRIQSALHADQRISRPIVFAMLCQRHLAFELDRPLNDETIVMPAPIAVEQLPNIRAVQL